MFYQVLIAVFGLDVILSENNCLASNPASTVFARLAEKSGVPAYNPRMRQIDKFKLAMWFVKHSG